MFHCHIDHKSHAKSAMNQDFQALQILDCTDFQDAVFYIHEIESKHKFSDSTCHEQLWNLISLLE